MNKAIDHKGIEYDSLSDMCEAYSVSTTVFLKRYEAGWSVESSLTKPSEKGVEIDHKGKEYNSLSELCETYTIPPEEFLKRINAGWTVEEALTIAVTTQFKKNLSATDHKGVKYETTAKMCEAYSIPYSVYTSRINNLKWSLERALTTPVMTSPRKKKVKDHKGIEYESVYDMCEAYGILYSAYLYRIKKGWSLEKALTVQGKRKEKKKETKYGYVKIN